MRRITGGFARPALLALALAGMWMGFAPKAQAQSADWVYLIDFGTVGNPGDGMTAITLDLLMGNNGQGIGVDIEAAGWITGTPLMNYGTHYSGGGGEGDDAEGGRNTFILAYSHILDGSALEAAGKSRNIIYEAHPYDAQARNDIGDIGFNDLLIGFSGQTLTVRESALAMYGTGAYMHVGRPGGATHQHVTDVNDDNEYTLDTETFRGRSSGAIYLDNSIMAISGGMTVALNDGSSLNVDNHSALILTSGVNYTDPNTPSMRWFGGDFFSSSEGVGNGSIRGYQTPDAAQSTNRINITNNSLFRLYARNNGDTVVSDEGVPGGMLGLSILVDGNSSMEVFTGMDLPTTEIGHAPPSTHLEINEDTLDPNSHHSRLVLGKPITSHIAQHSAFYTYAEYFDPKKPDFSPFLNPMTVFNYTKMVPNPNDGEGNGDELIEQPATVLVQENMGDLFDAMDIQFDRLIMRAGSSLIGYGTLSGAPDNDGEGEDGGGDEPAGPVALTTDKDGYFSMRYGSTLMPAVAVLQIGDKTILDGSEGAVGSSPWAGLPGDYANTRGDLNQYTNEQVEGTGIGRQTVASLYTDRNSPIYGSRFAPASLEITGNLRFQAGSVLQLVAVGDTVSTLNVVGVPNSANPGEVIFEKGSFIQVLAQTFVPNADVNVSVGGAIALTADGGIRVYDPETGIFSDDVSSLFRDTPGATIVGQLVDWERYVEGEEAGVDENDNRLTEIIEDGALVISINQGLNASVPGIPTGTGKPGSYAQWLSRDVIPPYFSTPALVAANPKLADLLDNYSAYTTTGGANASNDGGARINPVSTTYTQQQASVVEYTVRNAMLDRLSAQRPNSGVSAISTVYNEENTDPAEPPASEDYYICGYKVWSRALANFSEKDTVYGEPGYKGELWGVMLGAEQTLDRLTRGVAISYTHSALKRGEDDVQGYDADLKSVNASLYGSLTHGHLFVDGMVGYTFNRANENRTLAMPATGSLTAGFHDRTEADYDIHALSAAARFGAMYYLTEYRIMPTIGFDYSFYSRGSGREKWSDGSAAFSYDSQQYSRFSTPVGLSVSRDFHVDSWLFSPEVRASWAHQWIDDSYEVEQSIAGIANSFMVRGTGAGRNIFSAGVGLTARYADYLTLVGSYDYRHQNYFVTNNFNFGFDLLF